MVGRVEPSESVVIGATVVAVFVPHESWTELRFRVVSDDPPAGAQS